MTGPGRGVTCHPVGGEGCLCGWDDVLTCFAVALVPRGGCWVAHCLGTPWSSGNGEAGLLERRGLRSRLGAPDSGQGPWARVLK